MCMPSAPCVDRSEWEVFGRSVYMDDVSSLLMFGEAARKDRQGGNYAFASQWMRPLTKSLANENFYWQVEAYSALDNGMVDVSVWGQPPFGRLFGFKIRPVAAEEMVEVEWPMYMDTQRVRRFSEELLRAFEDAKSNEYPQPTPGYLAGAGSTLHYDQAIKSGAVSYTDNSNLGKVGMVRS